MVDLCIPIEFMIYNDSYVFERIDPVQSGAVEVISEWWMRSYIQEHIRTGGVSESV